MKFLKWYSTIVVSLSVLFVLVQNEESDVTFWAIVFFTPVLVYLWKKALEK